MGENETIEETVETTEEQSQIEEYEPLILFSVITDNDGYITQYCTGGYLGNETAHFDVAELPSDFFELWQAYKVVDDALVLDTNRIASVEEEKELAELRQRREDECFSVINRGGLWYELLTAEQKTEIMAWYKEWLDVTETRVIPTKPTFLSEV